MFEAFLRELETGKGSRRAIGIAFVEKAEAIHLYDIDVVGDLAPTAVPDEAGNDPNVTVPHSLAGSMGSYRNNDPFGDAIETLHSDERLQYVGRPDEDCFGMVLEEFKCRPGVKVITVRVGHQCDVDLAEGPLAFDHLPNEIFRRPLREELGVGRGGTEKGVNQHRPPAGTDEKSLIGDGHHFDRRRSTAREAQQDHDSQYRLHV